MRAAHVVAGLAANTGGVASSVIEAALALDEVGVEVAIYSTDLRGPADASDATAVRLEELPHGAERLDVRMFRARPPRRLAFSPSLARALRRDVRGYDLVHIHSLYLFPQFAAWSAARAAALPCIVSAHGALDPWLGRRGRNRKRIVEALWQRRMLEHAAAIHFGSAEEAQLASQVAPCVPRAVIPNPINLDDFARLPAAATFRNRFLGGFQGQVVLFLGRITPKKRVDLLIEAAAAVVTRTPECFLVIAGPDPGAERPSLERLASELGISEKVAFVGMLGGDDKLAALNAADVWVLPSHSEGASMAFVEALAAGCVTVAPPAVTIAADAARVGASVSCELTAPALAEVLGDLIENDHARAAIGSAARAYAQKFDRGVVGQELVELYDSVAHRTPTPRALSEVAA